MALTACIELDDLRLQLIDIIIHRCCNFTDSVFLFYLSYLFSPSLLSFYWLDMMISLLDIATAAFSLSQPFLPEFLDQLFKIRCLNIHLRYHCGKCPKISID